MKVDKKKNKKEGQFIELQHRIVLEESASKLTQGIGGYSLETLLR